jgi:hypothetical protein
VHLFADWKRLYPEVLPSRRDHRFRWRTGATTLETFGVPVIRCRTASSQQCMPAVRSSRPSMSGWIARVVPSTQRPYRACIHACQYVFPRLATLIHNFDTVDGQWQVDRESYPVWVVDELKAESPRFRERCARSDVEQLAAGPTRVNHAQVDRLDLYFQQLEFSGTGHLVVVYWARACFFDRRAAAPVAIYVSPRQV